MPDRKESLVLRRVLFSGISEAARAAIIIVIAIAAISAYYFITRYIRRKK